MQEFDEVSSTPDVDILAVHQALERLAMFDAHQARIVELRFFGGLSIEEAAETLGVGHATSKQQERVDRLAGQLDGIQNAAEMLKSSKSQMEEQVKQIENQIQQSQNEEHRSGMQAAYKDFKNSLAQLTERETQLGERLTTLAAQLHLERSKLDELNNVIDGLQREMELQQLP